ncbi:MAG: glycosyltransferase family 9 protein [Pseudomonadota bacterium]
MHKGESKPTERILFVTLSNIGDLVMTTPVLQAINDRFPSSIVDVVADRRSGALLSACPFLGELIWKKKRATWREQWQFLKTIRSNNYALAIDLRGPWLAFLARAEQRGIKRAWRTGMHAVQHHFSALPKSLASLTIPPAKIWLSTESKEKANELLKINHSKRVLSMGPGANWPGKIWPTSYYADLANLVSARFDELWLFGGPDDRDLCAQIADQTKLRSVNLCGRTSLMESAACLAESTAFVGNDSGIGHMAAALNVPSLTVFGEGEPDRYRPWGSHSEIVLAPNKQLDKLAPTVVAEALLTLISSK